MQSGRLMRSRDDRKIAGVAGGMAQYFGVDPTLVRVFWAVAVVMTGGFGILVYIVLAIVLPEGESQTWRRASAVGIVEERYARGEISAEELHRMRKDLESR